MKKIIIIVLVLLIVVAGAVIFGLSKIGPLVQTAVNTYGPKITKTDVRLGDVDVSLFSARAKLKDFYLGNPKGFKSPEAMKVGSILVDVDENSITGDTIIIDRIEVLSPQLTYEKIAKSDNFQSILKNIRRGAGGGGSKSGSASQDGGATKKLIIRDFRLKDGKVNLAASLLGQNKSVSAELPEIHLTGIGEKKGGLKAEEVFKVIFDELTKKINSPDVMSTFSDHLKGLKLDTESLSKGVEKEMRGVEDQIKGKIKGLLGN